MIFAALVMMLSVQQAAARPRPCTAPLHRQFDFWVGAWDVIGANGQFAGTNRIELTALWGERGKTVYRLLEKGELEVTDSVKRPDGSWAEFGRSTLKRK
jgi:hypothetical protein